MPQILDPSGRPYPPSSSKKAKASAWEALEKLGVEVGEDGGMKISPEALQRIRAERMRRMAISSVPSTQRYLTRDAGGVGVSKSQDRVRGVTLDGLRRIRERSPMLQVIHQARAYATRAISKPYDGKTGSVGWKVAHKDHHRAKQQPPEIQPFVDRVTKLLESPAPSYEVNTTQPLMAKLMEDLLTINRPCVEVLHSAIDPGRVVQIRPVDGALIWPTLIWLERWKNEHPRWFGGYDPQKLTVENELEIASLAVQFDVWGARYCIVRDGILEGVAGPDRLIVAPIQNRTDIQYAGYWPSHVEQAMDLVSAFIRTFDYNANYFTRGMLAEFAFMISGDVHDDDVDAFTDMIREGTQGVDNAWEPPVIQVPSDGDVKTLPLKESNREMMFEVWSSLLAALQLAIYREHTSTVNVKAWDGSGSGGLNESSKDKEIDLARSEGLQGDIGHLNEEVLNVIAKRAHPDLRVFWYFGAEDQKLLAEIYDTRTNIDLSPNDVAVMEGRPARGYYLDDDTYESLEPDDPARLAHDQNVWNWPKSGNVATFYQAQQQQAHEADMMQQQGQQQAQGAPTGWEDDEDGYGGPQDHDDGYGQPAQRFPFGGGKPAQAGPTGGAPKFPQAPKPGAPPGGAPMRKAVPRWTPRRPATVRPVTVVVYHLDSDEE